MAVLYPTTQFFDNSGDPLASGKIYTYVTGTSTPQATYTDSSESGTNPNPLILSSSGRGEMWLAASQNYDIVIKDSNDNTLETLSNISGSGITISISGIVSSNINMNGFDIQFDDSTGINDENNNELINFTTTSSAVNEVTIANAAASSGPTISATGSDTNIDINLVPKGTGVVSITGVGAIKGTSSAQGELRFYEDTDNGSNYVAVKPDASIASNSTIYLTQNTKVLIGSVTASNNAALEFTGLVHLPANLYRGLKVIGWEIEFDDVLNEPGSAVLRAQVGVGSGPTYRSDAAYNYVNAFSKSSGVTNSANTLQTSFTLSDTNASVGTLGQGVSGRLRCMPPSVIPGYGTGFKMISSLAQRAGTALIGTSGYLDYYGVDAEITAIKFFFSSGNILSGNIRLYYLLGS